MEIFFILLTVMSIPAFFGMKHFLKERNEKKRLQALALAYEQLILENNLCVEHYEVIGNKVLALDSKAQKLLFVNHEGLVKTSVCLPLIAISEINLIREKNKEGAIAKVYLELKHKRTETTYQVCFFDDSMDPLGSLLALSRRAMHWKNRIDIHTYPGNVAIEESVL